MAITNGDKAKKIAWDIRVKEYHQPLMYWAYIKRQAILLAQKYERGTLTIKGICPNWHATNMYQKPMNYGEFLAYGGGN